MQITLYPAQENPTEGRQTLALKGKVFIPAQKTEKGWVNARNETIKVHWWTYAPDEATATGRDTLKLNGPAPLPTNTFMRIKKPKPFGE